MADDRAGVKPAVQSGLFMPGYGTGTQERAQTGAEERRREIMLQERTLSAVDQENIRKISKLLRKYTNGAEIGMLLVGFLNNHAQEIREKEGE